MNGEIGSINAGGSKQITWLWEKHLALGGVSSKVKLFILNKDCVTFGKGKVEVKSWKCVVNLEL